MNKKEWASKYVSDLAAVVSSSPVPLEYREALLEQLPRFWAAVDSLMTARENQKEGVINAWEQAIDSITYLKSLAPDFDGIDINTFNGTLDAMTEISASVLASAQQLPVIAKKEMAALWRSTPHSYFLPLAGKAVDVFIGANQDLGVGAYDYYASFFDGYASEQIISIPSDMSGGVVTSGENMWVLAPDSIGRPLPSVRLPFPDLTPSSWQVVKPSPSTGKRHIMPGEVLFVDVFPRVVYEPHDPTAAKVAHVEFCDGYAFEEYYSIGRGEKIGFRKSLSPRVSFFNTFAPLPIYNYYNAEYQNVLPQGHLPLSEYMREGLKFINKPVFPSYRFFRPAVGFEHYSISEANYIFYYNEILEYHWKYFAADGSLFVEFKDCLRYDEPFHVRSLYMPFTLGVGERIEGRTVIKYPTFTSIVLDIFPSLSTSIQFPRVVPGLPAAAFGLDFRRKKRSCENVKSAVVR